MRSILFATDLHESSRGAQDVAVRLAQVFEGPLTLCHVVPATDLPPQIMGDIEKKVGESLMAISRKLHGHRTDRIKIANLVGHPVTRILEEAKARKVDLILIGAGTNTFPAPFRMAPIAETLLQQSPTSIMAVRPGSPAPEFRKILCPVDLSETSLEGLKTAIELCRAFKADLEVLYVMTPPPLFFVIYDIPGSVTSMKEDLAIAERELDTFLNRVNLEGVTWSKRIRSGTPAREICSACREFEIDVLVMGAVGRSALTDIMMGTVCRRVLHDLPCSIMLVR